MSESLPAAGGYWAKVNYYDSGAVEVTCTSVPVTRRWMPGDQVRIHAGPVPAGLEMYRSDSAEVDAVANKERAGRRAKAMLRRLGMTLGAARLLTLTFRRNLTSESEAWACWRRFVRLFGDRFPEWRYVVVAERQSRGAVHFHAAVKGFQPVRIIRECWLSAAGEGNIDVTAPRGSGPDAEARIARYLSKYISKAFADGGLTGRHRYRASKLLVVPVVRFWMDAATWREACVEVEALCVGESRELTSLYLGDGWSCIWGMGLPLRKPASKRK